MSEAVLNSVLGRGERLLRLRDVESKTGLGRSSIYRFMNKGVFPAPVKLGTGTVRWKETDVDSWISALPVSGRA